MNIHFKYFLIITAIAAVIILPPIICFKLYVCNSASSASTELPKDKTDQPVNENNPRIDFTILIDPGHGGFDPGKVSPDGIQEKQINLEIALKLRDKLLEHGFAVFLTRDTDCSLDSQDAKNKKISDLRNRTSKALEVKADLYISIHQNSYSAEYVHGAQVFYYSTSDSGKLLAENIQNSLVADVDPDNTRLAKGNSDYLVLTDSPCTAVIVECGFLSNSQECRELCTSEYQSQIASAIAKAVASWQKNLSNPQ